jgi:peptidoglycan hydrolase CwlO-like protein
VRSTSRLTRRLVISVLAIGALAAATPPSYRVALPPDRLADSYTDQIGSLQQQYSSLGGQLQTLQGSEAAADAQAAAVQQQIDSTQTKVAQTQAQIDQINLALAQTAQAIQVDTAHLNTDKSELTQVMVVIYTAGGTGVVAGLVDSQSVEALMEKLESATAVSQQFQQLIGEVKADEQRLATLQQTQQAQLAQAAQAESQLESLETQLQGQEAQLKAQAASLDAQATGIIDQQQSLLSQIATVQAEERAAAEAAAAAAAAAAAGGGGGGSCGYALCPFAFGDIPDSFPWGQCTWYVASLVEVTWWGNADEWLGNAQAQGYSTGSTPAPGAIVVWGPYNGYSEYGHVAYVVAVVSPTDFYVDEANFDEVPGDIDSRQVTTLNDVEGFIYGG